MEAQETVRGCLAGVGGGGGGDEREAWPWLLGVWRVLCLEVLICSQCQEPEIWGWLGYTRWIPEVRTAFHVSSKYIAGGTLKGI